MTRTQKTIKKYNIIEKLEESNYAIVYKVEDVDKKVSALKIARTNSLEYNEVITRELQILS